MSFASRFLRPVTSTLKINVEEHTKPISGSAIPEDDFLPLTNEAPEKILFTTEPAKNEYKPAEDTIGSNPFVVTPVHAEEKVESAATEIRPAENTIKFNPFTVTHEPAEEKVESAATETEPTENAIKSTPFTVTHEPAAEKVESAITDTPFIPRSVNIDPVSENTIIPLPPVNTANLTDEPAETIPAFITEPVTMPEVTIPEVTDIRSYFASKGFDIDVAGTKDIIPAVESLAYGIALNFDDTSSFIRYIRDSISKKRFDNVTYFYGSGSPSERTSVIQLAEKLADYGILADVFVNKSNNTIRMTISSAPKVINFISGDFMEMFSNCVVKGILKKYAKEQNMETELYTNVIITKDGQQNELDLVFRVDDKVFWAEIKSGKFNPDTYRLLGERMGVIPDRLILLAAAKTNEQTDVISSFYDYYCANIQNFRNKLCKMIEKAFKEDTDNV